MQLFASFCILFAIEGTSILFVFFFLMIRRPRSSPLFPYTTLFRSAPPPASDAHPALAAAGEGPHPTPGRRKEVRGGVSALRGGTCWPRQGHAGRPGRALGGA